MPDHPPWRQLPCQVAKVTGGWKAPAGPGYGGAGGWTHSEGPTPVPSQLQHGRPQHIAQATATEGHGAQSVGGGTPKVMGPSPCQDTPPQDPTLCCSQSHHGKSEPREAQMSTALGQVTGDLWLWAHQHCPLPPSVRTQGPGSESGGSRKPGSESGARL